MLPEFFSVFKLLFGSGFLNSWVDDLVLVLQELLAVQSSGGDTDLLLETLRFSLKVLEKENELIVKKTDETPLDVRVVN